MKKTINRIISSLMVAVMIMTAAPLNGFVGLKLNLNLDWLNFDWLDFTTKSSAISSSGSCGENVTYTFDESTGLLTISGTGTMTNYINSSPFRNSTLIKNVVIKNGVTSIGQNAFRYCKSLTSITIPDSVTIIGSEAFACCTGLTSITIGNGVKLIGEYAFNKCTSLTNITLPNSLTKIDCFAFLSCTGLTSITIPESVKSIYTCAFYGCTGLTSITIPENVTTIGTAVFSNCYSLTSIVVDKNNTVYDSRDNCNAIIKTSTNELIQGCKNTIIPNSVTSIGSSAFAGFKGIKSITIGNGVKSIGSSAFNSCTGLTSVTIGNSVTSIGSSAFNSCTGLTSITIPKSVTSIGDGVASGCSNLKDVYYTGTQEQWEKLSLSIGFDNGRLTGATIHYNSSGGESGYSDELIFINGHDCMADCNNSHISDKGFFNSYFANESNFARHRKLLASKLNDSLSGLRDFFCFNFNFSGYQLSIDYYDLFLTDVFTNMAASEFESEEIDKTILSLTDSCVGSLKAIIDPTGTFEMDDNYWEQFSKWIFDDNAKLSDEAENSLKKLFKNNESAIKTSKVLGNAFQVIDKASIALNLVIDIYNSVKYAIKLKVVVDYISKMDSEVFDILEKSGNELHKMGEEDSPNSFTEYLNYSKVSWSGTLKSYSSWFLSSLADFKSTAEGGNEINPEDELIKGIATSILNASPLGEILCSLTVNSIAKFLTRKLNTEAAKKSAAAAIASEINAAIVSYTITFTVLDCLLGNSVKTGNYQRMNYSAFIEWALSNLHDEYADKLINDKNLSNAKSYHNYFTTLKSVEQVCYKYCYNFASYEAPISLKSKTDKENYARIAGECNTMYYKWKNTYNCCFDKIKTNNSNFNNNIVNFLQRFEPNSVKNLVDELNAGINKTVVVACPVNVLVKDKQGQTVLSIVNDEIQICKEPIVAGASKEVKSFTLPDSEEYNITITPYDNGALDYFVTENTSDYSRCVEFYDVPIVKNQPLYGDLTENCNQNYELSQNDKKLCSDYDSNLTESCTDGHKIDNWESIQDSSCVEHGILRGVCKNCNYVDFEYTEKKEHLDNNNDGKCDYCNDNIKLVSKVSSVSISNVSLILGSQATIIPTISADSGVSYTTAWKSSDSSVATIDSNGKVTGIKAGIATITCTITDEYGNVVSDTCTVIVKENSPVSSDVVFSLNLISETDTEVILSIDLVSGVYNYACFEITYSDNISKCLSISSGTQLDNHIDEHSDIYGHCDGVEGVANKSTNRCAIASVYDMSTPGSYFVYKFQKANNSKITANDFTLSELDMGAKIINNIKQNKVNSVSISDITLNKGSQTTVTPTISADSGVKYTVTFKSSKTSVATVDNDGNVKGINAGTATITCTVKDENGNTVSDTCTVTVNNGRVKSVSVNGLFLDYKSSGKLNPNVAVDDGVGYSVTYSSSNSSVASVSNNGSVYGGKRGNATITCTVTDEYGNSVTDTCNVTVSYTWWQWLIKIVLFGWIWY